MLNFIHDYLIFDEFGIKEILCQACANPIKTRAEIKSRDQKTFIRELSKHLDYREIPVILEEGKLAFIMVCDGCKFIQINDDDAKKISDQLKRALKLQLSFEGKLPDLVDEILKSVNYNVIRKAEVAEVTAALRGA